MRPGELSVLVVAKAPVPGKVKTRLGAAIGATAAAELAAAALLDTIRCAAGAVGPARCHLALEGDLATALRGEELSSAVEGWHVHWQRGESLGRRLVAAYADAHAAGAGRIVQLGMDTPQVSSEKIRSLAALLAAHEAVLGPALDGGWWGLALRTPLLGAPVADVTMSRPTTGADTVSALRAAGLTVGIGRPLRDLDEVTDLAPIARRCAHDSHFAQAAQRVAQRLAVLAS